MLTPVRLLSGMSTIVDGQCASLDESLGAASMSAIIRTFVGVYAVVSLKIGLAIEALMGAQSAIVLQAVTQGKKIIGPMPSGSPPRNIRKAWLIECQQRPRVLKQLPLPLSRQRQTVW